MDEKSSDAAMIDQETINQLAKGVMELYEPPLVTIKTHLKELTDKQEAIQAVITKERRQLDDLQNDATLDALLADISDSKEKLVSISNSMMGLHKRVQGLVTRAKHVEAVAQQKAAASKKTPNISTNGWENILYGGRENLSPRIDHKIQAKYKYKPAIQWPKNQHGRA